MQLSLFIFGLLANVISAVPTPETQSTCLNEFQTCKVSAPIGDPQACCISNMICQGKQQNSTMGVCVKEDDTAKLLQL
ncbi:hypothetical protein N7466_003046 [Penicillium verhagenii]|uniref:uncharacterized protein n=1 Tax=Penicillium verhagenii TaxID=1562060 RepID=UPI0025454CA0|nr:uncharacterized protein N7466_003046 [Penicillium verhagenii]KAJ5936596.1 hypothetical protein N7466_003046 [Penicillium verhagenii]